MQDRYLYISEPDYAVLHTLTRHHPLSDELDRAIVVPSEKMPPDIVSLNSRVTYIDESNGVSRNIELVLPEEANMEQGKVSVLAPVGTALLGLKAGQSIEWPFPNGMPRRLRVISAISP